MSPEHAAEATIQQINLGYNAEQDRLLFRIGLSDNTELLVWLTHRITQLLWSLLTEESHMPTATSIQTETSPEQATEQFKQEAQAVDALQKMDFTTAYQERPQVRNDGAMLATNALLIHADQKEPSLELPCLEGISVRMNLNPELMLAMCNMLQLACKEAAWTISTKSLNQPSSPIEVNTDIKKVLH